jgi:predicted ATP-dependent protease
MSRTQPSRARSGRRALRPLDEHLLRIEFPPQRTSVKPPKATELLGQPRAMEALLTGLELYGQGYNLFVSGLIGSGRNAVVGYLLEEMKPACRLGPDRVYTHNFDEPNRPKLLTLPRGRGPAFRDEVEELAQTLQDSLRAALRARPHKASRRLVMRAAEARERRLMAALQREAQKQGCSLVQFEGEGGGMVADIYPLHAGEAVTPDALAALVTEGKVKAEVRVKLLAQREELLERLEEATDRARLVIRHAERDLQQMDRKIASRVLEVHFREFKRRWPQVDVAEHLEALRGWVLRNLEPWIRGREDNADDQGQQGHGQPPTAPVQPPVEARFPEFAVQVVKTSTSDQCPVVVESHPTYANLFGSIESSKDGSRPPLSAIHPGALLRSDGGYLILNATDVLSEPGVWQQLKRALKFNKLEVREFDPSAGTTAGTMQPTAIPIDVKVVLIGEPGLYERLGEEDSDFLQIFKIHSEFDTTIAATRGNLRRYADFLAWLARTEGLRPFDPTAAAALAEYGARRAGRRDRLTTRFGELGDIAHEAAHLAQREGHGPIQRRHVEAAVLSREQRLDLPREQLELDFRQGYLLMRTSGKAIGQVNALTVLEVSQFAFGKPCRITASTGAGSASRSGLLNIEREAMLSGPIHDKGVMILEGFLLETFAQDAPICLQATVCLEQTYGGVEGDSASSAELYALLSSLAKVPIDQSLAITGAVNQKGEIQAVAGVNEKIEGFFRICVMQGLQGSNGVLIPRANVSDLMLKREVVAAVKAKQFVIHAVEHVREGIELLTGLEAHEVFARAATTLDRFRRGSKGMG